MSEAPIPPMAMVALEDFLASHGVRIVLAGGRYWIEPLSADITVGDSAPEGSDGVSG